MRHLLVVALLAVGCLGSPSAPEPLRYVVVRGDTLGEIASAHGVSVDDLRAWNGIEGDLIEVDQVLLIRAAPPAGTPEPAPRRTARRPTAAGTADATGEPPLVMPASKPCKPPPVASADADGFATVSNQGLAPSEVKAAIDAFVPRTTSCMPEGWTGRATVQVDLVIGCDGRLVSADVVSGGGLSDETLTCIADRLRFAEFPAHDLPDGEQARVPLRYAWSE